MASRSKFRRINKIVLTSVLLTALYSTSNNLKLNAAELNIYTYDTFASEYGAGPLLKAEFEKFCACTINFITLADANLILTRLKLEQANTKADLVLGIDNILLKTAESTKLFAPHNLEFDLNKFTLPQAFVSDIFVPFDYGWLAFVHKKKLTPPADFNQFLTDTDKLKLAIQDPRTSSPGLIFIAWLSLHFPDFKQLLKLIDARTLNYPKSWGESYQMFLNEEVDFVWSYVTSPLYHELVEQKFDITAYRPSISNPIQVEYAAITKYSNHKDIAEKFLQFLLTPPAQKLLPQTQWMYPIAQVKLPAQFSAAIKDLTPDIFFPTAASADNLIKAWQKSTQTSN